MRAFNISQKLSHSYRYGLVQMQGQQRRHGGSLNKNKNIEVWNGQRENCDRAFEFNMATMSKFLFTTVVPFSIAYFLIKEEQIKRDRAEGKQFNPKRYL